MRLRSAITGMTVGLLAATAACAGDAEAPRGESSSDQSASGASIEIDHVFGTTVVSEKPERVVALGVTDVDPLLALGVTPVAAAGYPFVGPDPVGTWADDLVEGEAPVFLESDSEVNVEQIAELRPDLIVAISSGIEESTYDLLAQLAPTIARPAGTEPYTASREEATLMVARALGQEKEGRALVEAADAAFADARTANPAFDGAVGTVILPFDGQYGAYTPEDTRGQLMDQLGFELPADIAGLADGTFFVPVSRENLFQVDGDVLLALVDEETSSVVEDDQVLQDLPVVRRGDLLIIDDDLRAAITYNTVLSATYALDELTPLLADALAS